MYALQEVFTVLHFSSKAPGVWQNCGAQQIGYLAFRQRRTDQMFAKYWGSLEQEQS